jgi:hypothetical protein
MRRFVRFVLGALTMGVAACIAPVATPREPTPAPERVGR